MEPSPTHNLNGFTRCGTSIVVRSISSAWLDRRWPNGDLCFLHFLEIRYEGYQDVTKFEVDDIVGSRVGDVFQQTSGRGELRFEAHLR